MSSNLDVVRSIFAEWERGDFSSLEWAHPNFEFVAADGASPGRWTGRAGIAESTRAFLEAWADVRVKAEEYRELDDERVLALTRVAGRGRTSGLDLGQMRTEGAILFTLKAGKVMEILRYLDRDAGLRDLGLAPADGPP